MCLHHDFKIIPGFSGYSACLLTGAIRNNSTGYVLTAFLAKSARRWYRLVAIKSFARRVHRLVMAAMLGRELGRHEQVRHLDGDASNNAVLNLAVGSAADNARDKLAHGTNGHRLRNADVREMRALAGRLGCRALAARYGVTVGHVHNVVARRAWRGLP